LRAEKYTSGRRCNSAQSDHLRPQRKRNGKRGKG
jgi:hypothetical protein